MGEIIFLLLLAGVGVVYLVQAGGYKTPLLDNSGGPAMFPRIVCVILIALIVLRIVQIISQKKFKGFRFFELFKGSTGLFSISTIAMIFLIEPLGFIVTCFLYMTVVGNGLYYMKTGTIGTVKNILLRELLFLAFVLGLYFFFTQILYVGFPRGILSGLNI